MILSNHFCTFIPNNAAPDGTVTRALQGLTTLANELAENSGADTSITGWLESWFGKWKGMVVSIFTSLVVVAGVLTATGFCIIPCVRGLVQWLIETAVLKQMTMEPPPYSDKMMILEMESKEGEEEEDEEEDIYQITPQRKVLQKSTIYKEEKGEMCE